MEEELDIGNVVISEISEGEFVYGVDTESDDDLVSSDYRGLRDVDGWQRRDLWGGSAGDVPNRSSTRTFISTPASPLVFYLRPYIPRVSLVRQRLQH